MRKAAAALLLFSCFCYPAFGQKVLFAGMAGGISTLSGDARSVVTPSATAVSLYKPRNGPLLNVFAGVHLNDYVSLQGNYLWNSNPVTLTSSTSDSASSVSQQERSSSQHAVIGDLLVYFRQRRSRVRPYLSVGTGFVHLVSREKRILALRGSPVLPPARFSSTNVVLRVAVGMDVALGHGWDFRYSFSEVMSSNPISQHLFPPGTSSLKNFQNLFGIVRRF